MIQCPLCGYENRDGSKFCGNCGARLTQSSGLTCPMCGEPNKVESVFCSKCGARLVPLIVAPTEQAPPTTPPIKGLSLPAKPPAETPAQTEPPAQTAPREATSSSEWLDRLRTLQPEEEAPAKPASEEEAQVPEGLGAPATPSAEEAAPRAPVEAEEDIPDWLRTSIPTEPRAEEETPPSEPAPSREDWLRQLREATTAVEEVPDWLKPAAAIPATEEPAPAEPSALPPLELASVPIETAIPEWLRETAPEPSAEKPAPVEEEKPGETLIESLVAAAPPTTPVAPAWLTEEPAAAEEEDLPDWLRTPVPIEPGAPLVAEPAAPAIEPAAPDQVPAWLTALKPGEVEAPFAELEKEPIETSGPLFGLAGVLPLAAAIAEPHALPQPPAPRSTEGARAFEAILASAPASAAPAVRPRRVWTMRPLIYLLLALAIVIPFFVPFDLFGLSVPISGGVAAEEFVRVIDALPPNSTVLLSFDYEPGLAGEMDLQATAIVRHLIRRPVKIVAVSTLETGPQMARRVLEPAARAAGNYDYGVHYVILGYLPGNEAALSKLATDGFAPDAREAVYQVAFSTTPVGANVKTLRDVALVIEFAGTDAALRMWMEQVQPRANARIVAGVSAAVEPNARAYRSAGQLTALIGGLLGAAQYEILSQQPQPGLAVISVNAQTAAQLTLVAIVILGNIVYWVRRPRRVKDQRG